MTELSIIVISFNTKDLTLECIESVFKEGSKINYEVIVVDNNSNDGSVKELRRLWRNNPKLKLIENVKNLGFAKAVNIGIENSKGKHVLLLNSDTVLKKRSLVKLVEFVEKKKGVGVVGVKLLNTDGSVQASCYNFPTVINAIYEYWLGVEGAYEKYYPKGKGVFEVDALVGAAFLITREALSKVGMLGEKFFMYYEDIDYCKRVQKAGLKVCYISDIKVIHHHGESGKGRTKQKKQLERLTTSSKLYHGYLNHYLINAVIRISQIWKRL